MPMQYAYVFDISIKNLYKSCARHAVFAKYLAIIHRNSGGFNVLNIYKLAIQQNFCELSIEKNTISYSSRPIDALQL